MVAAIIALSAAVLMISERFAVSLIAYIAFSAAILLLDAPVHGSIAAIAFFAALATVKLGLGPAALVFLVRRYRMPTALAGSLGIVWRCAIAAVALGAAHLIAMIPAFAGIPNAHILCYALFTSAAIVVLHRNLLAHVIGLLTLGGSMTLAGALFSPALPGAVELADSFDVLIATLVGLTLARAILAFDPRLDIRALRSLRG